MLQSSLSALCTARMPLYIPRGAQLDVLFCPAVGIVPPRTKSPTEEEVVPTTGMLRRSASGMANGLGSRVGAAAGGWAGWAVPGAGLAAEGSAVPCGEEGESIAVSQHLAGRHPTVWVSQEQAERPFAERCSTGGWGWNLFHLGGCDNGAGLSPGEAEERCVCQ